MRLVAESFAWPFRGRWRSSWAMGVLVVLFLPLLFVPLLGYAIEATRAAERDPEAGPPPWRLTSRLLTDGSWTFAAILLTAMPYLIVFVPLAGALDGAQVWHSSDAALSQLHADVLTFFILALPWGLFALLVMPHCSAAFAAGGRPHELFDYGAAIRGVRRDFATWNVAVAAIVTGWAIGLACAGLFCVGVVPGIYYAILVSAHASATLRPKDSDISTR